MFSSHSHEASLRLLTAFFEVAKMGGWGSVWKLHEKNLTFWGRLFKESITVEIRRWKEVKRLEAIARHDIHPASRYILSTTSSQALF